MKILKNKTFPIILCVVLAFSLCGCEKKEPKKYQNYIKSLIAINYLGAAKDYINATGANEEDANALYNSNIELLTNNILSFYNIELSEGSEARQGFVELAKNIYSHVNYKVSPARKDGTAYLVDVTIYPINLFEQTAPDVTAYINKFNQEVASGLYSSYTVEEYEQVFSEGLLDILNNGCITMTYKDPVTITVEIVKDDNIFYISDYDFLQIDAAMISSSVSYTPVEPTDEITEEGETDETISEATEAVDTTKATDTTEAVDTTKSTENAE